MKYRVAHDYTCKPSARVGLDDLDIIEIPPDKLEWLHERIGDALRYHKGAGIPIASAYVSAIKGAGDVVFSTYADDGKQLE